MAFFLEALSGNLDLLGVMLQDVPSFSISEEIKQEIRLSLLLAFET